MIKTGFKNFIVLLTLCIFVSPAAMAVSKGKPTARYKFHYYRLKPFNTLVTQSGITVYLENSRKYQIVVKAPKNQPVPLNIEQDKGTVTLSWKQRPKNLKNITITLKAPNINRIILHGDSQVFSRNIRLSGLRVINNDEGYINLKGRLQLLNLVQRSSNKAVFSMIHSPLLRIHATGKGKIKLAGVTKQTQALLKQNAYMDSRYLRSYELWVKTEDLATADVLATHHMAAFAYGDNNINYYKTPDYMIHDSRIPGDVLQKGFWQ